MMLALLVVVQMCCWACQSKVIALLGAALHNATLQSAIMSSTTLISPVKRSATVQGTTTFGSIELATTEEDLASLGIVLLSPTLLVAAFRIKTQFDSSARSISQRFLLNLTLSPNRNILAP